MKAEANVRMIINKEVNKKKTPSEDKEAAHQYISHASINNEKGEYKNKTNVAKMT